MMPFTKENMLKEKLAGRRNYRLLQETESVFGTAAYRHVVYWLDVGSEV